MATTKTLTPTNQAITLAAFTEKPDNRTNVTNDDKLADAVNALNSNLSYKVGDVFGTRQWRAAGRIINSGKGLYCWIDLAKPVVANSFNMTFDGQPNIFGISGVTTAGTISNKTISGNELQFVIDLTSTHTSGQIGIAEFSASITLT